MPEILDVLNDNQVTLQQIAVALAGVTSAPGVHSAHATILDGAAITVWTPAGGKRFQLQRLLVACDSGAASVPHEVKDGAATLAWASDNGTNTMTVWLECGVPGYTAAGVDQALTIVNHSGGPVSFVAIAIGNEV